MKSESQVIIFALLSPWVRLPEVTGPGAVECEAMGSIQMVYPGRNASSARPSVAATPESIKRRIAPALSPLLLQLRFIGFRRGSRSAVFFELPNLRRAHKADIPFGNPCGEGPSDVLHFGFRGQSLVLVERTFADREADLALNVKGPAKDLFL